MTWDGLGDDDVPPSLSISKRDEDMVVEQIRAEQDVTSRILVLSTSRIRQTAPMEILVRSGQRGLLG